MITKTYLLALAIFLLEVSVLALVSPQIPTSIPVLDKGHLEGNTYKNISLGLELKPPPGFMLDTPQLTGTSDKLPLTVTVKALSEKTWLSTREAVFFYADTLAYYPQDQRSTTAYMRKVVRANQKDGFELVERNSAVELGGTSFVRTDFFKRGPAYEVVLARACERQALVFVFTGSEKVVVDKLIAGTQVNLDLFISGCGSPDHPIVKK